jgi:hypothetical protein
MKLIVVTLRSYTEVNEGCPGSYTNELGGEL